MLRPFSRFCVLIGAIPASIIESISYEEQLIRLIKFLKEKVIPAIEGNTEAIKAIENWIENVDLQEFVDNKLDEMAESGELEEIISAYLNSQAIFGYSTVSEMKAAENLISGSYAKTLGYYAINDGGEGIYKIREITNEDVVDEGVLIALNNDELVAELVYNDSINLKQYGVKESDNTTSSQFKKCADYCIANNLYIIVPKGEFNYNGETISITDHLYIKGENPNLSIINIQSNIYLFSGTAGLNKIFIENIGFNGGYGVLNNPTTGSLVGGIKIVNNNRFMGYSKTAIGTTGRDNPYWKITNNTFRGAQNTNCIGIVMPDKCNQSAIENNCFEYNKVHIKLATNNQDLKILKNDFISWNALDNKTDIWIVVTGLNNAFSTGLQISMNKFGNEGEGDNSKKILIASDSYYHSNDSSFIENTVYSTDLIDGTVNNISITDNEFRGNSNKTYENGIIMCYCKRLKGLYIKNRYYSSNRKYVLYIPNWDDSYANWTTLNTNIIEGLFSSDEGTSTIKATNTNMFVVYDSSNFLYTDKYDLKFKGGSSTKSIQAIKYISPSSFNHEQTFSYDNDSKVLSSAGGYIYTAFSPAGKNIYVEFEADSNNSINEIKFLTKKGTRQDYQVIIPLTSSNRFYRVELKSLSDSSSIGFIIGNGSIHFKNFIVYASDEPLAINDDKYANSIMFNTTDETHSNMLYFDESDNKLKVKLKNGTIKIVSYE